MAGTRKQKETTKQSQVSARTKTTSKTTQKSAQTPKNKTTRTGARASEKRRETKPQYEEDTGFLQSEAVILGTFAVCVLLFLSNFHICGFLGDFFSRIMLGVFGCIGYLAPLLLFAELLFYASNKGNIRAVYKMIAVEVLLIVLCGLAQLVFGGGYREGQTILDIYKSAGVSGLGGGVIGGVLVMVLHTAVGTIGAYVVLLVFMIISLVCITEKSFVSAVKERHIGMQRKTTAEEKSSTRNVRRKNADSGKSSAFRAWILLRPISRELRISVELPVAIWALWMLRLCPRQMRRNRK